MSVHERTPPPSEWTPGPFPRSSRYRVISAISSGESGTLYVGALRGPNGFERRVAIRRANLRIPGAARDRRRFMGEARVVARLNHPNVVSIHDVEDVSGEILFITDYVEGVTLAQLQEEGPLPLRVAGRILLDAAIGLAAIHALQSTSDTRGASVHTHVSAAKILVGTDGRSRLSGVGVRRGPDATPSMGVFAMGKLAWETLTAHPLLSSGAYGDSTSRAARAAPVAPPSEFAPELSADIDAVLLRALARDPIDRSNARAFATELEDAFGHHALLGTRGEVEAEVHRRCGERIEEERRRLRAAAPRPASVRPKRDPDSTRADLPGSRRSYPMLAPRGGIVSGSIFAIAVFLGAATWSLLGVRAEVESSESASARSRVSEVPSSTTTETSALASSRPPPEAPSAAVAPRPLPPAPRPRLARLDCEELTDRAAARRAASDLLGAEALYREALALNPRYLPARIGIADLDWDGGRTDRARRAYRSLAEQYSPDLLPARVAGRARSGEGDGR